MICWLMTITGGCTTLADEGHGGGGVPAGRCNAELVVCCWRGGRIEPECCVKVVMHSAVVMDEGLWAAGAPRLTFLFYPSCWCTAVGLR